MTATIDHIALYVEDLDAVRSFYTTYFGGQSGDRYHNPRTGLETYFVSFDGGTRLEVMRRPGVDLAHAQGQLGWVHLAFSVGSIAAVDELTHRLAEDGYRVVSGPRRTGDGYYESCVLDPEGNEVEIVA